MHPFTIPEAVAARVAAGRGAVHPFARLDPRRTALVLIDMQNGYRREDTSHACCAMAKRVVPAVNRLAGALRAAGGAVTDAEHAASPIAFHLRCGDVLTASECIAGFASEARGA